MQLTKVILGISKLLLTWQHLDREKILLYPDRTIAKVDLWLLLRNHCRLLHLLSWKEGYNNINDTNPAGVILYTKQTVINSPYTRF